MAARHAGCCDARDERRRRLERDGEDRPDEGHRQPRQRRPGHERGVERHAVGRVGVVPQAARDQHRDERPEPDGRHGERDAEAGQEEELERDRRPGQLAERDDGCQDRGPGDDRDHDDPPAARRAVEPGADERARRDAGQELRGRACAGHRRAPGAVEQVDHDPDLAHRVGHPAQEDGRDQGRVAGHAQ
jgi:hypothetical protein